MHRGRKMNPQPSWQRITCYKPGMFTYSFPPLPKHASFISSHYESSSCLLFKTHIQITELRKTKAEMIPINLTCPETTTAGTVVYVLPDCFL